MPTTTQGPRHADRSAATIHLPRGVSRRGFIGFCGAVAAALAVPQLTAQKIAKALVSAPRLPVVWLGLQDCTADSESFLRCVDPSVASLLFDVISLDYHETLMVASGANAEKSLRAVLTSGREFVCVVEGSVPTANGGTHCLIAGRTAQSLVQEVTAKAAFTLAVGSCSVDGGLAAAAPNPTAATGVAGAVPGISNLVNLPGCPVNGLNVAATIVHYLTEKALPELDASGRPLFAYQYPVHGSGRCERFAHLIAGETVTAWGDAGHRNGWCLVHLGCRGPSTYANCYQSNWNETGWDVGTGAPCIGCTTPKFWDVNSPFYVYRPRTPTPTPTPTGTGTGTTSPTPPPSGTPTPTPKVTPTGTGSPTVLPTSPVPTVTATPTPTVSATAS